MFPETKTLYKTLAGKGDPVVTMGWAVNVVEAVALRCEGNGWTDFGGPDLIVWHCVTLARRGLTGFQITQYLSRLESESRHEYETKAAAFADLKAGIERHARRLEVESAWHSLAGAMQTVTAKIQELNEAAGDAAEAFDLDPAADLDLDAVEALLVAALEDGGDV